MNGRDFLSFIGGIIVGIIIASYTYNIITSNYYKVYENDRNKWCIIENKIHQLQEMDFYIKEKK